MPPAAVRSSQLFHFVNRLWIEFKRGHLRASIAWQILSDSFLFRSNVSQKLEPNIKIFQDTDVGFPSPAPECNAGSRGTNT